MKLDVQARDAARRAENYLRSRQSPDGGFCFYRWGGIEESSLADTWHAIAAFGLLGVEVPHRDAVVAFLQGFDITGLDDLYHSSHALSLVGDNAALDASRLQRIRALDAAAAVANERVRVTGRLEQSLRIVLLQSRFATLDDPNAIADGVDALQLDGGWGDKPNIGDTWLALAVLDACGVRTFAGATRRFVDSLQVASFGFTTTGDSTFATLDSATAGIRTCAVLGLPLRYRDDAIGYVLACQAEAGGFARGPGALPDVALTHRGLLALAAAGALPVRDAGGLRGDSGY